MAANRWVVATVVATTVLVALAGCSDTPDSASTPASGPQATASKRDVAPSPSPAAATPAPTRSATSKSATPTTTPTPERPRPGPRAPAWLSIPALGIDGLRVVAYRGTADDLPGTRIQNRGVLASPRGPEGGAVPGQIGNYIVTGHRTSHGAPFGDLPDLEKGAHIQVRSDGHVYDYRMTRTLTISFRSERSRKSQSAPVPGFLGKQATKASITLSTCATPEDHAAGNYWSDELGNPEHRIDKIGVLVDVRPA